MYSLTTIEKQRNCVAFTRQFVAKFVAFIVANVIIFGLRYFGFSKSRAKFVFNIS